MTFGVNWSVGLDGTDKRYMPYNGALSSDQLTWLEETLSQATEQGETAIVLCHVPLHPLAANNLCLLWNYQVSLQPLCGSCIIFVISVRAGYTGEVRVCGGSDGWTRP